MAFSVRVQVRSYELDLNGHVNHTVYHAYGEHARTELLTAAGCPVPALVADGLGVVLLETRVRFLRELRHRDELEVDARAAFGAGRTFVLDHTLTRADGVVAAEISATVGLIDSASRRLVPDPAGRLRAIATRPAVLGL